MNNFDAFVDVKKFQIETFNTKEQNEMLFIYMSSTKIEP